MIKWEKDWTLNANSRLRGALDPSLFRLEKKTKLGIDFYAVKFNGNDMKNIWRGVYLVRWGTEPLKHLAPQLKNWKKGDDQTAADYVKGIDADVATLTGNTEVLIGRIVDNNEPLWVFFFLLPKAVEGDFDLLAVKYVSENSLNSQQGVTDPIDDGTGHGN